jgi:hypothetical protein
MPGVEINQERARAERSEEQPLMGEALHEREHAKNRQRWWKAEQKFLTPAEITAMCGIDWQAGSGVFAIHRFTWQGADALSLKEAGGFAFRRRAPVQQSSA